MSFPDRTPGIKLILGSNLFNKLVGILDSNVKLGLETDDYSLIAERLKNKLLEYSIPRIDAEGQAWVDVRFFPKEASDMIWQLLLLAEKNNNEDDYFNILRTNYDMKKNKNK